MSQADAGAAEGDDAAGCSWSSSASFNGGPEPVRRRYRRPRLVLASRAACSSTRTRSRSPPGGKAPWRQSRRTTDYADDNNVRGRLRERLADAFRARSSVQVRAVSPSSAGLRTKGGADERVLMLSVRSLHPDRKGVCMLVGAYVQKGSNHGKKWFQKVAAASTEEAASQVVLYYWDERDGEDWCGWWFGSEIGSNLVCAKGPADASAMPPAHGWRIPWDSPVAEPGLLVVRPFGAASRRTATRARQAARNTPPAPPPQPHPAAADYAGPAAGDAHRPAAPAPGPGWQEEDAGVPPARDDSVRWEFEEAGSWQAFHQEDSIAVESIWRQRLTGESGHSVSNTLQVLIGRSLYEIDFAVMQQRSLRSGRLRKLRRVLQQQVLQEPPWGQHTCHHVHRSRSPPVHSSQAASSSAQPAAQQEAAPLYSVSLSSDSDLDLEGAAGPFDPELEATMERARALWGRCRRRKRPAAKPPAAEEAEPNSSGGAAGSGGGACPAAGDARVRELEAKLAEVQHEADARVRLLESTLAEVAQARDKALLREQALQTRLEVAELAVNSLKGRVRDLEEADKDAKRMLEDVLKHAEEFKERALQAQTSEAALEEEVAEVRQCQEVWRQEMPPVVKTQRCKRLVAAAQEALRSLVPPGHVAGCERMRNAVVTSVDEVINMELWKQYKFKREQLVRLLQDRSECPGAEHLAPSLKSVRAHFPHIQLEVNANESLLFHGTREDSAGHILHQGFDERLAKRELYGHGTYLTTDSCKASQYCSHGGGGCIILARVLLGHPYMAQGPMNSARPPMVPGRSVPYDAVIARPGTHNGHAASGGRQLHWEFVVPKGEMIYPELVIRFTC